MFKTLCRLWKNDSGGEGFEQSVLIGLIVLAGISIVPMVGTKLIARWNSAVSALPRDSIRVNLPHDAS